MKDTLIYFKLELFYFTLFVLIQKQRNKFVKLKLNLLETINQLNGSNELTVSVSQISLSLFLILPSNLLLIALIS